MVAATGNQQNMDMCFNSQVRIDTPKTEKILIANFSRNFNTISVSHSAKQYEYATPKQSFVYEQF